MDAIEWIPILEKACVLVTLAFLLTLTRLFPDLRKARLSTPEQAFAAIVFLIMGFAEVAITVQQKHAGIALSPMNLRIVAVAAAGILTGPWVGLFIGIAVTLMATTTQGGAGMPAPIGISMVMAGLLAGSLRQLRPNLAIRPEIGFFAGFAASGFRDSLNLILDPPKFQGVIFSFEAAALQGLSVALILLVIRQACDQEAESRAAAMAEVKALQARMDPHFLFNSLNLLAALSQIEPAAVPKATAHLGKFLRAAIDLHDQEHVALQQELDVVDAYLQIERLRFGDRLKLITDIDSRLLRADIPPFLLQPLIENAVNHGIQPKPEGGALSITARAEHGQLLLTVADDGVGTTEVSSESIVGGGKGGTHALGIIRRRLRGLYTSHFQMSFTSTPGVGTQVFVAIPLAFEGAMAAPPALVSLNESRNALQEGTA